MPHPVDPESQKRQARLMKLLQAGSSGGYDRVANRIQEARDLFNDEIAHLIEAPLNRHLSTLPKETITQKHEVARWLNGELRSRFGLSIRFPNSELAASLHVGQGHNPERGIFQYETSGKEAGRRRIICRDDPFSIEFMRAPERREAWVEYRDRVVVKSRNRGRTP